MKKRLIGLTMALIMSLQLCIGMAGAKYVQPEIESETVPFSNQILQNNSPFGLMTEEQFIENYVGDNYTSAPATYANSPMESSILSVEYSNIMFDPATREVNFDIALTAGNETFDTNLDGVLFSSRKQDHGINSIVGDLTDTDGTLEILYFEIYNDTDMSFLEGVFNTAFSNSPVVKLYMRCGDYLFLTESPVPEGFASITIQNTESNRTTDSTIDGFWFTDIVDFEVEMVEDEEPLITPYADYVRTKTFPAILAVWTIFGVDYAYYAKPEVYYRFTDITTSNYEWFAKLYIADAYCIVNGERTDSLVGLRITNIKIHMATGPYTMALNNATTFNLYNSSGNVPSSISTLLTGALSLTNLAGASAALVISAINDNSNTTTQNFQNTSNYTALPQDNNSKGITFKRGVGITVPSNYFMQDENQYIQYNLQVTASAFGSSSATSGQQLGQILIEFDYYAGDSTNKRNLSLGTISQAYYCNIS